MIDYSIFFGVIAAYFVVAIVNSIISQIQRQLFARRVQKATEVLERIVAEVNNVKETEDRTIN